MAIMIQVTVTQRNHCEKNLDFNAFLWFLNNLLYTKMLLEILISITPNLVYFMLKSWLSFADPEYKFKVARTNFFPQPNVSDIVLICAWMILVVVFCSPCDSFRIIQYMQETLVVYMIFEIKRYLCVWIKF